MPGYLTAVISTNVNEGAIEGAFRRITEVVKERFTYIIAKTYNEPGIKAVELQEILDVSECQKVKS